MIAGSSAVPWIRGAVIGAMVFAFLPLPARAQTATGTIEGVVVDPSGAVLPGATITVVQPATGFERSVEADTNGRFRASFLPVGSYELTAALAGFETRNHTGIVLTIGQTIALRVPLPIEGVAESVDVSAVPSVVEPNRASAASTVDRQAVQDLPVNGRNFIDFVLLTPGVTRDARAGDLSFAGQRGTLNSLIVDGMDNNNTFAGQALGRIGSGRAPYQFSQESVQEFQINSNAFSAEYGRAGAAVINAVTRSGTNTFAGSLFEFYRDKALNANNAINVLNDRPKSPYHYHQFGGTIGGPLRKQRHFLFASYDGQRNSTPNEVFFNLPADVPDDAATRAAIERLRPLAFSWIRRLDQDVFLLKTDHQVNADNRVSVRYNHQDFTGTGYENGGPQNSLEHSGDSLVRTRTLNATWARVLGQRIFNELRAQYAHDGSAGTANSANPEAAIRQGNLLVLLTGRNNFSPRATTIDRAQIADTLTWARGAHYVKTGFDVQFDRIDSHFPGFFGGMYRFNSLASYAGGRPRDGGEFYQQAFPGPGTSGPRTRPDIWEYSFFVQDEWKPHADVTLTLGVRYDLMDRNAPSVRNPDEALIAGGIDTSRYPLDTDNIGPRLGIAWSPWGRRHVVRVGWGVFYGRVPAIALTAAQSNNGINTIMLRFTGDAVPTYPATFSEIPAGSAAIQPNIFSVDEDFEAPRLMHATVALERQLDPRTSVAVTYLCVDGTALSRPVDRNIGSLTHRTFTIAGSGETVTYPYLLDNRPFPSFGRVVAFDSRAVSRYNGLTVEMVRRTTGGAQFRVAYTIGRVEDTAPDATAVQPGGLDDRAYAPNPIDSEANRSVGNNDQRHRFVASGVVNSERLASRFGSPRARALARGWSIGGIVTAQSGRPFSARVATDINNDGNVSNDLAPGTRRNAFRLPSTVAVDLRVAREVPLPRRWRAQLIWEAFNLFNRDNIIAVEPGYYDVLPALRLSRRETFGRPTADTGERIMQLALRVVF